ncbi:hypothetical protein ACOME3_003455 [Neoechinorhynchus agilis]
MPSSFDGSRTIGDRNVNIFEPVHSVQSLLSSVKGTLQDLKETSVVISQVKKQLKEAEVVLDEMRMIRGLKQTPIRPLESSHLIDISNKMASAKNSKKDDYPIKRFNLQTDKSDHEVRPENEEFKHHDTSKFETQSNSSDKVDIDDENALGQSSDPKRESEKKLNDFGTFDKSTEQLFQELEREFAARDAIKQKQAMKKVKKRTKEKARWDKMGTLIDFKCPQIQKSGRSKVVSPENITLNFVRPMINLSDIEAFGDSIVKTCAQIFSSARTIDERFKVNMGLLGEEIMSRLKSIVDFTSHKKVVSINALDHSRRLSAYSMSSEFSNTDIDAHILRCYRNSNIIINVMIALQY